MAEIKEYSQFIEEGNKKNFDSQEARKVIDNVKNELNSLKEIVAKNPWNKWWETSSLNNAIKHISTENGFYKIEANNKVTFRLDKVSSYLSVIYDRILKPGWPRKYIDQKNEKIFNWTILAVQIALEAINKKWSTNKKYDVWIINWQLNQQTISALKKFQKDFLWVSEMDWKPWKKTIWKLLWVLNAQLLQKWEAPVIEKKKAQAKQEQKKQNPKEIKQDTNKKELSKENWKNVEITRTRTWGIENVHVQGTVKEWDRIVPLEYSVKIDKSGNIPFYMTQKGDTISSIRNKLKLIPEYNYLWENWYKSSSVSFNIPNSKIRTCDKIPIPLKLEERTVDNKEFVEYSKQAIDRIISSNSEYSEKVRQLVNVAWKWNVACVMAAFARNETTWGRNEKIWTWQLYRMEKNWANSMSYFHIVINKWAWKIAKDKLKLTDSDMFDPVKSWMLFLGYWCESVPKLENYLNPKKSNWYTSAQRIYNRSNINEYRSRLLRNFNQVRQYA